MNRLFAPLIALLCLWAIPDIRGVPGISATLASRVDILVLVVITLRSMWHCCSPQTSIPNASACKKHAQCIHIALLAGE
jgi:cytochrome b561